MQRIENIKNEQQTLRKKSNEPSNDIAYGPYLHKVPLRNPSLTFHSIKRLLGIGKLRKNLQQKVQKKNNNFFFLRKKVALKCK